MMTGEPPSLLAAEGDGLGAWIFTLPALLGGQPKAENAPDQAFTYSPLRLLLILFFFFSL